MPAKRSPSGSPRASADDAVAHRGAHQRRRSPWFDGRPRAAARAGVTLRACCPRPSQPRRSPTRCGAARRRQRACPDRNRARRPHVEHVAAAPGVLRLAFGTLDYALDLDIDSRRRAACLSRPARIVIASRVRRPASPVAGVTPAIDDEAQLLRRPGVRARASASAPSSCIHPRQVAADPRTPCAPARGSSAWARSACWPPTRAPGAVQARRPHGRPPRDLQAQRTLILARD